MNKRAFVSYAMNDREQSVLTLLSDLLKEEGFLVDSSYDGINSGGMIQYSLKRKISESDLFIGIITQSNRNNHVLTEWQHAQDARIPSLLLVEDTISIRPALLQQQNVLKFNRFRPESAMNKAIQKIRQSKMQSTNSEGQGFVGWMLGGLAVLALIKLLSDD